VRLESTSLWIGVVWIVVTTISIRDVRDFRLAPLELHDAELAPAVAAS